MAAGTDFSGGAISFGFSLSSDPAIEIIPVGGPTTASCTGSAVSPTAAPGYLCVYKKSESNVTTFNVCPHAGLCNITADPFGAELVVRATGAGRFYTDGTWAVTAP